MIVQQVSETKSIDAQWSNYVHVDLEQLFLR